MWAMQTDYPTLDTAHRNRPLIAIIVLLHAAMLVALPLYGASNPWVLLMVAALIPASIVHWGLIHEAIHKHLDPLPGANEHLGRALGVLMGASFHVLRFGHLMHHKLNRDWHSERITQAGWRPKLNYYFHLFAGLYLGEFIISLMFTFLPRRRFMQIARASFLHHYPEVAVAGERFFYERGHVRMVRQDMLMSLALFGGAALLYGKQWPLLLLFFAVRAMVISFLDNVYHYETPADNSKAGKELQLPPLLSKALLHSNYHETHHLNPHVPWRALPATHAAQARPFDGAWLSHAAMQLRAPRPVV